MMAGRAGRFVPLFRRGQLLRTVMRNHSSTLNYMVVQKLDNAVCRASTRGGARLCVLCARKYTIISEGVTPQVTEVIEGDAADDTNQKISAEANYNYFKALASLGKKSGVQRDSDIDKIDLTENSDIRAIDANDSEKRQSANSELSSTTVNNIDLYEGIDIENVSPAIPKESFSLATYAAKSETLSKLLTLGVDLSKVEKKIDDANYILKMDYVNDVEPYIMFLSGMDVSQHALARILTQNPGVLRVSLDDLEARTKYLESKRFTKAEVGRIVSKAPLFLTQTSVETDTQLGYLQKDFRLTGDEVRLAVLKCPKLTTWNRKGIKQVKFALFEYMGFSDVELKQLILTYPKLYTCSSPSLIQRFDYLHNEMGMTHQQIIQWPNVLRTRQRIMQERHQFLKHLGRDQYDPKEANYVSPQTLASGSDAVFSTTVAKDTVKNFNDFLKTL